MNAHSCAAQACSEVTDAAMLAWFDLVFGGLGPEHRIELRYLISGEEKDPPPDDDKVPTLHSSTALAAGSARCERWRFDVYAGVAWRRPGHRGRKQDCTATRVLWVEYDTKHHGGDHAVPRLRLWTFGLRFSAIVWTGGGYYALLRLAEPLDLRPAGMRDRVETANKRLARAVGDDVTLDAVHDIPRILRPVGTFNYKYGERRLVEAIRLEPECVYAFEEVEDWLEWHYPTPEYAASEKRDRAERAAAGDRPGDQWAAVTSWASILEPHGWKLHRRCGSEERWTRPHKRGAVSATINYGGYDLLYVFSSNAQPFKAGRGYGKFSAYALLNFDGDHAAAARALAQQGYGAREHDHSVVETSCGRVRVVQRPVARSFTEVTRPVAQPCRLVSLDGGTTR
jgi:hypothetical protein